MFPGFLSGFWPRKRTPLWTRCAWHRENCTERGEQKELKHSKWRVRGADLEGPRCTSVSAWPHCLLRHCLRGQESSWETLMAQFVPLFQGPVVGLGVLVCVTQCCCSLWLTFFVINTCSSFPSVVVFQAGYVEAIWAAALPGIRSTSGEMWEDEKRL